MGARYLAVADSLGLVGEPDQIDASKITPSTIMDALVASGLIARQAVTVEPLTAKEAKAARGKKVGTRDVSLTWQSGELWNWVKAEPADASAEDVAAKLAPDHSVLAYQIAAAPPMFGIPKKEAAKRTKAPASHRPEDDSVDGQLLTFSKTASADDVALQEASPMPHKQGAAKVPDAKTTSAESAALHEVITDCLTQLQFAESTTYPWGLSASVAPAIKYLVHKEQELKAAEPSEQSTWLHLFQAQKERLSRITGAINDVVSSAKKLKITDVKSGAAAPAREILEKFALAAGLSHLAAPSEAKLAEGLRLQSLLAVRALQATEGDMVGGLQEGRERASSDPFLSKMVKESTTAEHLALVSELSMLAEAQRSSNDSVLVTELASPSLQRLLLERILPSGAVAPYVMSMLGR